jgi:nitrile hydratase accessory protein
MTRDARDRPATLTGAAAPPRRNGELVFEAPWQGRALGMAVTIVERLGLDWGEFQRRLIAAIAARPDASYYESWVAALEALLVDHGVVSAAEIARALRALDASPP